MKTRHAISMSISDAVCPKSLAKLTRRFNHFLRQKLLRRDLMVRLRGCFLAP
jgi:hypothetical protein